ncbi:MAG: ImmA/IrrE family metallo-endopeptidase [Planctomycetaceae bacterium]|nr:ImmA/IrrE family metallo-endopeptidase [Planctomycetaceae bacterium]
MRIRRKHIRNVVAALLEKHNIEQAPIDVRRIAANEGFQVIPVSADDSMSGFLDQKDGAKTIGLNDRNSPNRQRFTIAHELGHAFLHASKPLYFDEALKFRNKISEEGTQLEEIEANLFAAELLMPQNFLESDFEEIVWFDIDDSKDIQELADKYQVSQQAMTIRLGYLELL